MNEYFIAKFRNVRGRYLVRDEGGIYGGQKILTSRQEKYGNKLDPITGLYFDERYRVFDRSEVLSR